MSATTGYFALRLAAGAAFADRGTTAGSFNLALRFVSGVYSGGGGFQNDSASGPKTLFPRRDVQMVDAKGFVTDQWYGILQYMYEVKQGGDLAPSVPDIVGNVASVQNASVAFGGQLTNAIQTINTNAASGAATIEVLQTVANSAAQIPAPVQTVPDYDPPEIYDPLGYKKGR